MQDRRRFPRYDCTFKVRYASQGLTSLESDTHSQDISKVGVRMAVTRILKKGSLLKLDIDAPDNRGPVSALGVVRWTRASLANPRLFVDAGVEFLDVEPYGIDRLIPAVPQPSPVF